MADQKQHHTVRPWGEYFILYQENGVWVKRIEVKPQARLSLQKHAQRSEKWVVVKGKGVAIVDDQEILIEPGVVVDVPLGAVHRLANKGNETLILIEVATGSYLGEDDIIRLQDDYSRS